MPADVTLKSLEIKGHSVISSVKCTLSNNESSPVFEKANYGHSNLKTINFDPQRPVKAVSACDAGSSAFEFHFKDA